MPWLFPTPWLGSQVLCYAKQAGRTQKVMAAWQQQMSSGEGPLLLESGWELDGMLGEPYLLSLRV